MAITPAVNDIIQIAYYCRTNDGQIQTNVRTYRVSALAGTGADMLSIAGALDDNLVDELLAILPTVHEYIGSVTRRIGLNPTQGFVYETNAAAGLAAGDPLPSQVAGLIKVRASEGPPRVRGRFYVPSSVESMNDSSGRPNAAWDLLAVDIGNKLTATVVAGGGGNTATLVPILYNRAENTYAAVDGFTTRTFWATQKRRSELNRGDGSPF